MTFEWDDEKNEENVRKHDIPFEYAALVFEDEFRIEKYDYDHSINEDRYDIIGKVDGILFVVVTYKEDDVVRIISAREAEPNERREYEWQWSGKPWHKSKRK